MPVIRVAIHPNDFDHERTMSSITRTLDALRRHYDVGAYSDALFEPVEPR
jgi:hypothetical protein